MSCIFRIVITTIIQIYYYVDTNLIVRNILYERNLNKKKQ